MPNRMLTEQEVAAILKTTPRAVRRLDGLRRLYLKPTKRREVRYSETDVQNYIKEMWGRILSVKDIFPAIPFFQEVIVLQKE